MPSAIYCFVLFWIAKFILCFFTTGIDRCARFLTFSIVTLGYFRKRILPWAGSEEEVVEETGAEFLLCKFIGKESEVASEQVQENVTEGQVIVGLCCKIPKDAHRKPPAVITEDSSILYVVPEAAYGHECHRWRGTDLKLESWTYVWCCCCLFFLRRWPEVMMLLSLAYQACLVIS